jgi:cysteinyl-tRNA synthetase
MSLTLYNTFSKREEEFVPLRKGKVSMYTCGPTVYGRPHIGNYSSFLMADLLRRWLEVSGYTVTHVKNITDVGHLVADQDDGEDKVEKEAQKEKVDPLTIARRYTDMYLDDEHALNMLEPKHRPRATEYVKQMIAITKILIEKGHAYETEDGVYFAVETFPAYGQLSGNTLDKLNAGSRVDVDEAKKHPADFALWKKCVGKNAHHVLRWPSPWGEGFPGWHIECSAMSSALLGPQIDIHTGGEDNIFPHHECEIAQSECSNSSKPFVRLWLHKRRIDLAGTKMSKSLGNVLTIPDISAKGYSPLDLRYYFLSVHYRTNLKFSFDGLDSAHKVRLKVIEWFQTVEADQASAIPHPKGDSDSAITDATDEFKRAMDSDLNTPGALAPVFTLMHHYYALRMKKTPLYKEDMRGLIEFIAMVRATFGCFEPEETSIPPQVEAILKKRLDARENKDFKASDQLRDEIKALGYEVRDADGKQVVKKL